MHRIALVFSLILFFGLSGFSQYEGMIPPVEISFDLNKLNQLDFGTDSLQKDEILLKLFPAPMKEDDPELSEWRTSAYWSCPSCLKRELSAYEYSEEPEKASVPFERNFTWCESILYYKTEEGKGSQRAIASFSTAEVNDGTGRFTPGVLSLALFEYRGGHWQLIDFNPFVNFQGQFTAASPVDEVKISSNGKTYFVIRGGEANGVSPEDYWPLYQGLYLISEESLSETFHIPGASCEENGPAVGSVWNTEITDLGENFFGSVLEIKTAGLIVKEYNWGLPEVLLYISKSDFDALPARFRFIATQKFTRNATTLMTDKPAVTIQYTDSKGTAHEQVVTTQNIRIK